MAKQFSSIDDRLRDFIARQHIFFTASAAARSRVNVSPRETLCLRIISPNTAIYLDRTGSGNETSAHMKADGRMTIMLCAMEGPPMILRLYGHGRIIHRSSLEYSELLHEHYDGNAPLGARQIVWLDIDLVQTSCGFGVPLFGYEGERQSLDNWANTKGQDGIEEYWREKNVLSMDGLATGLFDD
ncbi:pyridoxamine 5'-phosphate oxidase family protein [Rhizobium freirei]|uniref:pyridoxamine 5'-phosphate oxidase family protein n=1 Tax=Rhizobium freirei TaxID=1353277 RepID=UPI00039BAA4A|nr:pyridoxamine 5'-phosphate oxidase family protein [Rhizobium freirei]